MSLKDSVALFFGESEKAVPFFNALYKHANYTNPPNSDKNPEAILNLEIFEMMMARNFNNKAGCMGDNDVHNQFVDFIVNTALLHKHLDKPTTTHPTIHKMKESFDKNVDDVLGGRLLDTARLGVGNSPINDFKLRSIISTGIISSQRNLQPPYTDSVNIAGLNRQQVNAFQLLNEPAGNSMDKSYFDYLCALCYLALSALATDPNVQSELISEPQVISKLDGIFTRMGGNCGNRHPGNGRRPFILMNQQNLEKDNSNLSHLCWTTYWDKGSNSSAVKNLTNLFQRIPGNPNPSLDQRYNVFLNEMHDNFVNAMKEFTLEMCRVLNLTNTNEIYRLWYGRHAVPGNPAVPANQNDIISNFHRNILLDGNNRQQLLNKLTDELKQKSFASFKVVAGQAGLLLYQDYSVDDYSKNFCQHILTHWGELDTQARTFYRDHLAIFQKMPQNSWGTHNLLLDDRWMDKFAQSGLQICNVSDLRLNLAKMNPSSSTLMFEHTLPYIPVDKVENLWYTDANNRVVKLNKGQFNSDVLKKIYKSVYMSEQSTNLGRGSSISLPSKLPQDERKSWDHKLSQIVRNVMGFSGGDSNMKRGPRRSLEELMDMESNTVWFSDGTTLFRKDHNGNKITYSEFMKNEGNCENTLVLNVRDEQGKVIPGAEAQCDTVASCLLQSPERLEHCLSQFQSSEMFNVAQRDLRDKMNPGAAEKLLRVFHVRFDTASVIDRNRNRMEITQPVTFNQWVDEVLNSPHDPPKGWSTKFRENLRNNQHLLNYVRGIIEFVRANPAILNKDKFVSRDIQQDEQIVILNATQREAPYTIGNYTWPNERFTDEREVLKYNVGILANTSNSVFMPAPSDLTFRRGIPAVVGTGLMSPFGLNTMSGGALPFEESECLKHNKNLGAYLKELLESLKNKHGIRFMGEDEAEIKNFCDQLVSTEKKIWDMVKILENLQNLQNFVGCYDNGRYAGVTSGKVLSLEEIVSSRDLIAWLNHNIGDYQNCIYRGMEYINAGSNQVLKAYHDLIQASSQK